MPVSAKFASTCKKCGQSFPKETLLKRDASLSAWVHFPECPEVTSSNMIDEDALAPKGQNIYSQEAVAISSPNEDSADPADLTDIVNDVNTQVAEENETFDVSEKMTTTNLSNSAADDLAALKKSFEEFQSLIKTTKIEVTEVSSTIDVCNESEKELYAEYVKATEKIRKERQDAEKEKAKLQQQLSAWEMKMRQIEQDMAQKISALDAQKELEALAKELEDYFTNTAWGKVAYDYQHEDIVYAIQRFKAGEHALLNANKMGAGKMLEAQATAEIVMDLLRQKLGREPHVLWVTAKSIRWETHKQWNNWVPGAKPVILTAKDRSGRNMMVDMAYQGNFPLICNYDALSSTPHIIDYDWDLVIVDEVSAIKNGEATQRFNTLAQVVLKKNWKFEENPHRVEFLYTMTGTPVENKAQDMWPHLFLSHPKRFPSIDRFNNEFTTKEWNGEKWETVADIERIVKAMTGRMIRQDPERIDAGRPSKIVLQQFVERTEAQDKVYQDIKEGILSALENAANEEMSFGITAIIAQLNYLRQANVYPGGLQVTMDDGTVFKSKTDESGKIDRAMEIIEELDGENENVVVWATFKAPLLKIQEECQKRGISVAVITGDTKDSERDAIKQLFDDNEIRVLCTVLSASGGEVKGANFNKAETKPGGAANAIFLDLWWNPAINTQAEDRIWRQNNIQAATIYQILVDESVDLFIMELLQKKEELMHGIVERKEFRPAAEWLAKLKDIL